MDCEQSFLIYTSSRKSSNKGQVAYSKFRIGQEAFIAREDAY